MSSLPESTLVEDAGDDRSSSQAPTRLTTPLAPSDPGAALGLNDPNPWLSMALALVWDDIPVFPVWSVRDDGNCACGSHSCRSPGKHPIGGLVANGLHDATTEITQTTWWWNRNPAPNVAIPTGHASGVIVIDVDARHGGTQSLDELIRQFGPLPTTWTADTGGGGTHFYLRYPGVRIPNSAGDLAPGIDVRGDGGYAITPPSRHKFGTSYRWVPEARPDIIDLASPPEWLVSRVRQSRMWSVERSGAEAVAKAVSIVEGQRNNTLTRIAGAMRHWGCSEEAIFAALLEDNARRCQPPLPEDEVRRIARSIVAYSPGPPARYRPRSAGRRFAPFTFRDGRVEPQ